jgi:chromosome segregation ATPase
MKRQREITLFADCLREQLEPERTRADQAAAQAVAERARSEPAERDRAEAQGKIDGLKSGLEPLQEVLAQARQEAAETGAKAEQMARAAKDANERLARLHSRGVWARLRNRP